ncbi:glycerophosphodiester phosphodiesterase [Nocardioides agariphilus]|jgi:glycerophosphoryl diester phosphodiesterase|uniref:Glycerophosphodiester phosphodiesterase n=1 Tax=Nocardioides agariphilus TaxID=433664 RepID=A0A930VJK5_9ACTN|nr:glycerophosphodiester phosphodiesterase [Nocardioides agariphilus]MBF4768724.1 glycerophosphodiester phosphodiesterase [Nocardioides agariphilus]
MGRHRVLISAHRCNSADAVREAYRVGADYAEFDVRRAGDGTIVVGHDPVALADQAHRLDDVLAAVAESGLGAHVDLKGRDAETWAEELAERCALVLDLDRVVFTTGRQPAAAKLAAWAARQQTAPMVGLTLGQSTKNLRLPAAVRARVGELYPNRRWVESGAGVLVAHHVLARIRLLRWANRREVRVLVWTVDHPRVVRAALRDPRVWMVTTNHPATAVAARERISS